MRLRHRHVRIVIVPPDVAPALKAELQEAGIRLDMINASDLYEEMLEHVPLGIVDRTSLEDLPNEYRRPRRADAVKRAVDLVLGVVAAILVAPLLALAAIAIKLQDGGPVFYRQRRVGLGGAEFTMLKLRTMRQDAQAGGGATWSSADDQRVTAAGRSLRRWHVDELPQLWNVLRGEMSLVGPRPEQPALVRGLEARLSHYGHRHLLKPGITGWGQIRCGYAGTETGSAWKLCHDLYYLKHRSLRTDLLIMAKTIGSTARRAQFGLRAPDQRFLGGAV